MIADLILFNLVAYTPRARAGGADLVAIREGRILHVGDRSARAPLTGPHTRLVDCQGATLIPGFNDAHCHPVAFAMTTRYVDCAPPRVASIADLIDGLRARVAETRPGNWLRAANCDPAYLAERRLPTRWELDLASPAHPVIVVERSGQYCVLNSRALAMCGIDERAEPSDAGTIQRDPASGGVNGVVSGNHAQVAAALPPLAPDEIEAGLRAADRVFLESGITCLQDTSWSNTPAHWHAMADYKRRGLVGPRVSLCAGADSIEAFADLGLRTGSTHRDCAPDELRIGAAKIALDESTGNPAPPQELLDATALAAHLAGFQLAFHVPDLALLDRSLNTLDWFAAHGLAPRLRPRFEHCPACPREWLDRVAASGAIVVAQPSLLRLAAPALHACPPDPAQPPLFPFRSFLRHGIPLAFGSDAPLVSCAPLEGLKAAVMRCDDAGREVAVEEAISLADALRLYTWGSACASCDEEATGAIEAGRRADLVLIEGAGDWTTADDLARARVAMTLIGGRIVWTR
ncbi:amidohydrolase family protein [Aromatoleum toluolicum]|uniref:Amidohydrolase family protein n=1 Tax=Aromatoleum toluolicum TaxID=90060 RepID=A0ABX1NBN7_9RHOO|nr:amidohydrolase family protein [Aromatoleum toluolicum]NMF96674.1 amidohydrolase family protein [Aromatoleum toluolicum]